MKLKIWRWGDYSGWPSVVTGVLIRKEGGGRVREVTMEAEVRVMRLLALSWKTATDRGMWPASRSWNRQGKDSP